MHYTNIPTCSLFSYSFPRLWERIDLNILSLHLQCLPYVNHLIQEQVAGNMGW